MTFRPKVPKPTPSESRIAYERVADRSFGLCEICGLHMASETHHRLHRSQGGRDTTENLLRVCGWGNHTGCHGRAHSDPDRYENGWAVRSGFAPADVPVLYRGELLRLAPDGGLLQHERTGGG